MNIFQVKKNYFLIKKSWQNKLSLLETKLETKTIVNQGKNQIKTMKEHWRLVAGNNILAKKDYFDDYDYEKERYLFSRPKEMFNDLYDNIF